MYRLFDMDIFFQKNNKKSNFLWDKKQRRINNKRLFIEFN